MKDNLPILPDEIQTGEHRRTDGTKVRVEIQELYEVPKMMDGGVYSCPQNWVFVVLVIGSFYKQLFLPIAGQDPNWPSGVVSGWSDNCVHGRIRLIAPDLETYYRDRFSDRADGKVKSNADT